MRKLGIIIIFLLADILASAQSNENLLIPESDEVAIGAMSVYRIGLEFTISYELLLGNDVRWCDTELLISVDGGKTFRFHPSEDYVSGDIGRLNTSGAKVVKYDVEADKNYLADRPVVFKIDVVKKGISNNKKSDYKDVIKNGDIRKQSLNTAVLIAGQTAVTLPDMSYGLMVGVAKKFGGYLKARSDFHLPPEVSYVCDGKGNIEGGGQLWGDGTSWGSRWVIAGGGMFRAATWCYPYVGAGYGARTIYWADSSGYWVKEVSDRSCSGMALDAGVVFKLGKIAITLGVNNTAFKYTEAELGIGVMF